MNGTLSGNEAIYQQLAAQLGAGRMLHAFVFAGGTDSSRRSLASVFASDITPDHPEDRILVDRKEGKATIGVDEVEELIAKLAFKPYGERYAVIISEAHLLSAAAQNKLLKTLEEPVSPAVMMLLTENRDALLKTVLSRCSVYQLREPALEADETVKTAVDMMLELCRQGAPFYRKKAVLSEILSDKERQREQALMFVSLMEEKILAEARQGRTELLDDIAPLRSARRALRQVHNTAYTLKQLCLQI